MQNNKLLYLLYAYSALLVNVNFLDGSFKENNGHNLVWRINQITSMKIDDFYRVKCTILGEEVWFESNIPLKSSPEAFAGIFLLPALAKGATIHVKVPLDKEWLENIKEIIKVYHRWWGYPVRNPIIAYNIDTSFKQPAVSTGSCFSCGVDSFYTLLSDEQNIDYIVFSQGLDVSLLDNEKNIKILEVLNNICKNLNKKYIFLRTNIRNHSLIKSFDWGTKMNGPVLAALGHLLSKYLGKLIIPSSNYFEPNMKWGSHWLTDTFFSSASMQIIHTKESDAIIRPDKTALIAQYPIVQKSLRVCWKKTQLWNCSQCEKCIRTMIDLCSCNALENFNEVFDLSIPLVKRIDGINKTNDNEIHFLKESLRRNVPLDIKDAILNLIARSAKKTKLMHHFS